MAARRKRHEAHEEHENHERWLITYADMITLLMVLFIVLFAIGQTDLKKFEELKSGLHDSFGSGGSGPLDGSDAVLAGATPPAPLPQHGAAAEAETAAFVEATRERLAEDLARAGLGDAVRFRREARGLVITIVTDQILFDLGSAALRPEGRAVLDALASSLVPLPNAVAVEGHTDDRPMRGALHATNWELSTARATAVLRHLAEHGGIVPARLSAAGYADQRPLAPNDSEENRRRNRRVEIVLLTTVTTNEEA